MKDKTYEIMLNALIMKYGVMLTSSQSAEVLGISRSKLEKDRVIGKDTPDYIENNGSKGVKYTVQAIVDYQISKDKQRIKII